MAFSTHNTVFSAFLSLSLYFDSASAKKYIGSVTNRRFFSLAYRHVKNNHKNGQIFSINKICPIALVAFVCTEIGLTGFILLFLLNERASERTSADNDAPLFDFDENYYSIKALSKWRYKDGDGTSMISFP